MDDKPLAYCWHCGKAFEIKPINAYAGEFYCSEECRIENLKKEIELEKAKENKR